MKIIRQSTQYKKDFKRYRNQPKKAGKITWSFKVACKRRRIAG